VHRQIDDAVFHETAFGDQDHERPARPNSNEFDMLQSSFDLGRDHQTGAVRKAGEHVGRLLQHLGKTFAGGAAATIDRGPLLLRQAADFEQAMHEEP
jgi:hypothetical protein